MSDNPTQQTPDSRSFEERVLAHFDNLYGRLTALEETVDSRLRETRPIWEAVLTRLDAIENRLNDIESRLSEVEKEVRALGHAVLLIHEDNLRIRADQRDLRGRVEKLESQSTR